MLLPLLTRATEDDGTFVHIARRARSAEPRPTARIPDRLPSAGEQFRFHVDMASCIGCKCCVVACNEQNGNPADINWRRVGEVEGGTFPATRRAYFSMGCNHCLDPTCLAGCPVDAYSKDTATGIVLHSAETCIGCQYCTWTCSYGVPQFNADRGVVGKCDMCHGRLSAGQAPACVNACPEGAIAIEIVNVADWRAAVAQATAGNGCPAGDSSVSATRVTVPPGLPVDARPLDLMVVEPGDPHWPLVVMTVLTQLSAGAFAAIWIAVLLGLTEGLGLAAAAACGVAGLALAASTIHLGRPIHAYRAMKMWRRSWLSREVVLFGAFSQAAGLFAALLWFGLPLTTFVGAGTTVLGVAGVTASAYIYRVPSRPSWNSPLTVAQFMLTAVLLGSLFAATVGVDPAGVWRAVAVGSAAGMAVMLRVTARRQAVSVSIELRGTAKLFATSLRRTSHTRGVLLLTGGVALPLLSAHPVILGVALVMATVGELMGRYLFFVSAVPKHMTTPYTVMGSEAA